MKGKWGMMLTDGRGKLGGHVLTKNRQGAAVRTKVTPVNRATNSQATRKNSFTTNSQGWRGLTSAQIAAWNQAGGDFKQTNIFGDQYNPAGKNLYGMLNNNLALVGVAAISDPPVPVAVSALTALSSGSLSSAAMTVVFAPTPVPANHSLVIMATRPLSAGTSFAKNQFRVITTVAPAGTSPANTFAAYQTVFGTPVTGKKVFVKAYFVNRVTGQKGIPLQYSAIVA